MTPLTPETISAWLVDWSLLAAAGDAMPPRDPTMTMRTKKTKRTRTAMKSRRLSESPTTRASTFARSHDGRAFVCGDHGCACGLGRIGR